MERKVDITLDACERFLDTLSSFTIKIADDDDILIDEIKFEGRLYKDEYRENQKQKAISFVRKMFDKLGIVKIVNYTNQFEKTVYVAAQKARDINNIHNDAMFWFELKNIDDE